MDHPNNDRYRQENKTILIVVSYHTKNQLYHQRGVKEVGFGGKDNVFGRQDFLV